MFRQYASIAVLGIFSPLFATAADTTHTNSETGAVSFASSGGWSFGLPSVQAIATDGNNTAISPLKKTLPLYNFEVGVRAWKFLVPFFEFSVIDTGKASAQTGSVSSSGQADTFGINGGIRIIGHRSRLRPYAEFGGGILHQKLNATFTQNGQSYSASASGSVPDIMYGGGLQVMLGKKWGSDLGFDAYHLTQPTISSTQNYSAMRFGIFYQTKSSSH